MGLRATAMPRYFFDVDDGEGAFRDTTGTSIKSLEAVRAEAIALLPNIARDELPDGRDDRRFAVRVRDRQGHYIFEASLTLAARWLKDEPKRYAPHPLRNRPGYPLAEKRSSHRVSPVALSTRIVQSSPPPELATDFAKHGPGCFDRFLLSRSIVGKLGALQVGQVHAVEYVKEVPGHRMPPSSQGREHMHLSVATARAVWQQ
jgi:hypothetical protein